MLSSVKSCGHWMMLKQQADLHLKQWIELVNTTADADENAIRRRATTPTPQVEHIDMGGTWQWVLHFTPNRHYVPRMTVAAAEVVVVGGTRWC